MTSLWAFGPLSTAPRLQIPAWQWFETATTTTHYLSLGFIMKPEKKITPSSNEVRQAKDEYRLE
jgi:hypothetical protein